MVGNSNVSIVIYRKFFATIFPKYIHQLEFFFVELDITLNPKSGMSGRRVLAIGWGEIAFRKAQVIYGIEEIRFADPVWSADANDSLLESENATQVILKLNK